MTHYYDYYTHKFNCPDTPNPHKAPPKHYAPSKAGGKRNEVTIDNIKTVRKENDSVPKQTHNDVFINSLMKTDFFKEQKELYLKNKAEIDEKRRREQEKKENPKLPDVFENNICYIKSRAVALEIIFICKELMQRKDFTILGPICNQIVRSSTSTNANIAEGACECISIRDRINKFTIAYKECMETISWISLLFEIEELTDEQYNHLTDECIQIVKILSKSIHSMRSKMNNL